MIRKAFVMSVHAGREAEYARRHQPIWQELADVLKAHGVRTYSIFLDGSVLPELQKFLRTQKEKGAVEIAGKKWAVSFRSVFPSEPVWRKALDRAQEK